MLTLRDQVTNGKTINLDFPARSLTINNTGGAWIYVRVGGNDAPTAQSATYAVPPYTNDTRAVSNVRAFGFAVASPSGATPANAGSPLVTFFDIDQPANSTTIAQPQALFAPAWYYSEPVISSGGLVTLINPGAKRLQIFKIRVSCRTATYDQDMRFYLSAAIHYVTLRVPSGAAVPDELDLLPHGTLLDPGQTLDIQNGSAVTIQPGVFVFYSLV